jgi:transposase-like protein
MERGKKLPTSPILDALRDACHDEAKAAAFLEARRWGDTPACPRCGSVAVYQMRDSKTGERNKDLRWRCHDCAKLNRAPADSANKKKSPEMFTVRTESVLEESRLPLRAWCFALWSACSSKKGVSALQISRECEISYKSALYLMHRIRTAMSQDGTPRPKLSGTVEVDETYIGGKPRNKGPWNKRGHANKLAVIGIVQRGGELRLSHMQRVTVENLKPALAVNIDRSARLCTDESSAYTAIGKTFAGGHETVAHGKKEYARGDAHSNTIEGAFSLLKRGVYGTFHSVSRKHLHRYLAEFEFRYNARKLSDAERVALAVKATQGKRLTYAEQIAGS